MELFHTQCFKEVAFRLRYGLEDLGYHVDFNGQLQKHSTNIVLGYHALQGRPLPPDYDCIIYQLEQLSEDGILPLTVVETLRSSCVVWDYNEKNIEFLSQLGIAAIHKPLGFHPKMNQVKHEEQKEIDILFYGSKNERRDKILKELAKKFEVKVLFGVYGDERDKWIARSKIVILIYFYETKYFDDVRISYLLNNKAFSVIENTPHSKYEDFIVYSEYDRLIETCQYFLEHDDLRQQKAEHAYQLFSKYHETEFLENALAQSFQPAF